MNWRSKLQNMARKWFRSASVSRTGQKQAIRPQPQLELLENRVTPAGSLTFASGALTFTDASSPTITVAVASSKYTITDTNGLSGTITGWTISGNTATEGTTATAVTSLIFNTTNATFGTSTIVAATPVTITDAGNLTISGAITGGTTGNLSISAAGSIADNAAITLTTGTIFIAANTAGTGTAGFTQAVSGATITTTNTTATALTIDVNTAAGGTGNASIRTIAATTGTLNVSTLGGSILYAGTDTFSSAVTTITQAAGSSVATVTPAGTTAAPGATGFYAGEQVTIAGTNGVFDGTFTIQSVNSSGTVQVAEPSFTINTGTAAASALSVSTGTVSAPNGVLEAQALGVVGSDNLGSTPTGNVEAANYIFTTTGSGSIGTASRPIQTYTTTTSNSVKLNAGSGGAYLVEWDDSITLASATATGAGNIIVATANAGGHNLTVSGNVSTGSGNILLAADDELIINSGVTIGGSGFSGQVYLGANRDQGNDQIILDGGTIVTSNTSVYSNTGSPVTSTPGAVLFEDYNVSGTLGSTGYLQLGAVTVGNGGSITATTDPTLGIYDVSTGSYGTPTGQGSQSIVPNSTTSTNDVLNAGANGTVNLIADEQTSSTATYGIGESTADPITVSAGNVNIIDITGGTANTNGVANNSVYVTDQIPGAFSAVTSGSYAGTINLADTSTTGPLAIGGTTSTGDAGAINLTGADGVAVNGQLGSATTGAITASATAGDITTSSPITGGTSVTLTASTGNITTASSITAVAGITLTSTNGNITTGGSIAAGAGVNLNATAGTLTVGGALTTTSGGTAALSANNVVLNAAVGNSTTGPITINGPLSIGNGGSLIWDNSGATLSSTASSSGSLVATAGTYGTLATGPLTLSSTATTLLNVTPGNNSVISVSGAAILGGNLQVNAVGVLTVGQQFTLLNATSGISGNFTNASSVTATSGLYKFSASVSGNMVVLTVTTVVNLDVAAGTVTFLDPGLAPNITVSISGGNYTITDPNDVIVLDNNATSAGWTSNGTHSVSGPTTGISTITINTASGSSVNIAGIAGGSANVNLVGSTGSVTFNGAVTTSGNLAFSGYSSVSETTGALTGSSISFSGTGTGTFNNTITATGNLAISGYSTVDFEGNGTATDIVSASGTFTISGATTISDGLQGYAERFSTANVAINGGGNAVDFEGNFTATGSVTVTGVTNLTDGSAGVVGTLTGTTLNLTTTTEIGTFSNPLNTAGATIIVNSGAGGAYISQTGSANFSGSVTSTGTLSFTDPNAADTTTINAATSAAGGGIVLTAAGSIVDNANITATTGTIAITADSGGTGSGSFTEAATGVTITTTSTASSALTISVNTYFGGTGNASIRTIADSGGLNVATNAGSILYTGTDTYGSNVSTITEALGSNVATITPGSSTSATAGTAPAATGYYSGEQVTITGTGGVFDGTYTIQSVNSSGASQTAQPSFTINTGTAATSVLSVSSGTIAAPNGVLEAQALGVVGSDNLGSGPTGEVIAASYTFTTTGNGSIGTASRPIQTDAPSGNSFALNAGNGGLYVVDWGSPITVSSATATGAGNVVVVTANSSGHNLTLTGNASTGSGNILFAADDALTIEPNVTIGGSGFSGQVYLGANRDQGNDQVLADFGTITTSNTSVYNNTGIPFTSSPGAVLLEEYDSVGGLGGTNLELGNITVGNGGSITATTDATLGIYNVSTGTYGTPGGLGSEPIIPSVIGDILNAGTNGRSTYLLTYSRDPPLPTALGNPLRIPLPCRREL